VCANIAEAWRKRRYQKYFVSKLSDSDAESAETRVWLDFAVDCEYISRDQYEDLDARYDRIQGSLVNMMRGSAKWCAPSQVHDPAQSYDGTADATALTENTGRC
jgi:hypothetical protein